MMFYKEYLNNLSPKEQKIYVVFVILNRGQSMGNFAKEDISQNELTSLMAGGAELEALQHEIAQAQNS